MVNFVFNVIPNIWRFLWGYGSAKNFKENTLKYVGEYPSLPKLLPS